MQEITTDHERRARRAKAVALATVLADAGTTPDDVAHLTEAAWRIAASAATQRQLLGTTSTGKVRTVHPPHSDATVQAVQAELANLLALRAAQDAEAESVGGFPVHFDDEAWLDDDDSAEHRSRKATDSQGYRATVGQLDPETARTFAMFGQADR